MPADAAGLVLPARAPALAPAPLVQVTHIAGAAGTLRLAHGLPAGRPRGTMVVLPGRAEFIEKYAETLDDLLRLGFAVAMVEWRGQGLSARPRRAPGRGHIRDYAAYLDDLARALGAIEGLALPRPWLMLGHSMGGHIALRWLREGAPGFAAAVLTAPMLGIPLRAVPEPVARLLGGTVVRLGAGLAYAPGQHAFHLGRLRFEGNPLTSCPVRYDRFRRLLEARPELATGGATWGWVDASLRSIGTSRAPGYPEAIATPILLCSATEDRVVCNRSIAHFAERLPRAVHLAIAGARHDLLLERDAVREQLLGALDAFAATVAP